MVWWLECIPNGNMGATVYRAIDIFISLEQGKEEGSVHDENTESDIVTSFTLRLDSSYIRALIKAYRDDED